MERTLPSRAVPPPTQIHAVSLPQRRGPWTPLRPVDPSGAYRLFCTDCTTYAREVLGAAGVRTPPLSTPALNAASAWLASPASVPVTRAGSLGSAVTSAGIRTTELEETLQMSIPSEHLQSRP